MEFDAQDQDIIKLLTKLKDAGGEYPEHMLVARRRSFLKQMTEVGLGISAATRMKSALEKTRTPNISPFTSIVLETALITAIVIEISAMAYLYRDKLADFFQGNPTSSNEIIPTAQDVQGVSSSPAVISTFTPAATVTEPTEVIIKPAGTPIPDSTSGVNQIRSTPDPNGNNGNHYGQTPKPERTKENKDNNDKPPKKKDDKRPKEDKPPKDK